MWSDSWVLKALGWGVHGEEDTSSTSKLWYVACGSGGGGRVAGDSVGLSKVQRGGGVVLPIQEGWNHRNLAEGSEFQSTQSWGQETGVP